MGDIEEVKKYRDFIFLCELIGLLHDIGKYYEGIRINGRIKIPPAYHNIIGAYLLNINAIDGNPLIKDNQIIKSSGKSYVPVDLSTFPLPITSGFFNKTFKDIKAIIPDILKKDIDHSATTLGESLIRHHGNQRWYGNLIAKTSFETMLNFADTLDSAEDREGANNRSNKLRRRWDAVYSPFGHKETTKYNIQKEKDILAEIMEKVDAMDFINLYSILKKMKGCWNARPADTRIPLSDTSLWNHSYMVSSIFKTIICSSIIEGTMLTNKEDLENRLSIISIQSPNRDFLTKVTRLPDYNVRRDVLDKIRNEIKKFIEFDIPLGNCVYEDINGQYFLVPSLQDVTYLRIKEEACAIYQKECLGLILPLINIRPCQIKENSSLLQIGKTIIQRKKKFDTNLKGEIAPYHLEERFKPEWTGIWSNVKGKNICQVCHKMPAEKVHIFYHDEVCEWCGEKRKGAKGSVDEVRFINEVMDTDKRYALLVGEIGLLDQWLNGDYLQTTFVNKAKNISKPASPSRMMRIWEDTDLFDKEIFQVEKVRNKVTRLKFIVNVHEETIDATKNIIYAADFDEDVLEKLIINYFLKKGITNCNGFVSQIFSAITYNHTLKLELLFKEDTIEAITDYPEVEINGTEVKIKLYEIVKEYILNPGQLKNLVSEDRKKLSFTNISCFDGNGFVNGEKTVSKIKTIYSYSGEFMYLIPAGKAMEISNRLRDEFNNKYKKALGRLCLNIGVVFANHKYPLYMVLDAGKRMLKEFKVGNGVDNNKCEINGINDATAYGIKGKVVEKGDSKITVEFLEDIFKDEKENKLLFPNVAQLQRAGNQEIGDNYYPYILKLNSPDKAIPTHIKDIHIGDHILYTPGIFDFEWVDSSRARVNIILKKKSRDGWRKRDSLYPMVFTRPYRVSCIELMKEFISKLTEEIKNKRITKTALEHYRESLYANIYNLCKHKYDDEFPDASDKKLIEEISRSMITNMAGLEHTSAKEDLISYSKSLEIFDLLELKLFLNQN